ncbi:MAG: multicopper oxidase family protein [Geminicoccaceae bacterium]|nr:multicopper oxidase family protein [Geminicoccaceae bacterium]
MSALSRRACVGGLAGLPFARAPVAGIAALPVRLRAAPARLALLGEGWPEVEVWAYEGRVPGPVLRVREGEGLAIELENGLPEPTSLVVHGSPLPFGARDPPLPVAPEVPPGGRARLVFPLGRAGTFWYRPFFRAAGQVGRGLAGLLVVEEAEPYPADRELALVLDDWRFGPGAVNRVRFGPQEAGSRGAIGEIVTVEGRIAPRFEVAAGERLRLRFLNAANARIFALRLKGAEAWLLALDGRPLPARPLERPLVLAPAMRADLVVDVPAIRFGRIDLLDEGEGEGSARLASFAIARDPLPRPPFSHPPPSLPGSVSPEPDLARAERHELVIDGGLAVLAGARPPTPEPPPALPAPEPAALRRLSARGLFWMLNGLAVAENELAEAPPILRLARGRSHRIALCARTLVPVALHLHGHAFRVLARDGRTEDAWRDTILLGPGERVEIALSPERPGRFALQGTVLEHSASGMLGVVEVF